MSHSRNKDVLRYIKSKCSDMGGCWVWKLRVYGMQPFMWDKAAHARKPVRRLAWQAWFGTEAPTHLVCRFGTYGCVCPKHLVALSHSQAIKSGLQHAPHSKTIQRKKLQQAKQFFTPEQVQHILSRCMTQAEYAKFYGCHQSTISRVQSHTTNAQPNIFLSLMR